MSTMFDTSKLVHDKETREKIMACIQRNNARESTAIANAVVVMKNRQLLPLHHVRRAIRRWYRERWEYLLEEYEKVMPGELPPQ